MYDSFILDNMISTYLIDIIFLLIAAVIAVPFFQAIRLGAVPGFLIGGVVVGPYGLGLINNISDIGHLAEIGVVFLLFVIGIELKPSRLWQMRRMVFGLGTLQVLITSIAIGTTGYYLFNIPLLTSLLTGPALALSSTAFVLQLLSEQKLLNSNYGRTSFSVLLLQDLAVVPLLALIPLLTLPELSIGGNIGLAFAETLLILGLIILTGRYLLHPILHRVALSGNPEVFTASAVLMVLGTALVTEYAGLSMAMGAFLAGLLISDSSYKHQIMAEIHPFRGLLLGLFFMSMGMSLNLNLLVANPLLSFELVGLLILIKIIILIPLNLFFKISLKNSLGIALVLAQSGEFALVLFSLALQSDLLNEALYQQLLLIVLLSMLATPLLAQLAHKIVKTQKKTIILNQETPTNAPIVIAGYGRVGRQVGEILSLSGIPYVAMDSDPSIVEKERLNGHPVYYGDVLKPELLVAAGVNNAEVIIVTLNDPTAAETVVASLRKSHPDTTIYVRGHSIDQCRELKRLGASGAVSENIEASLELARMTLGTVRFDEEKKNTILNNFRTKYHTQIENMKFK